MLSLRDRLKEVIGPAARPAPPALPTTDGAEGEPASARLTRVLGGGWRSSGSGNSFVVTRRFDPESVYGSHRIRDFAQALKASVASAALVAPASTRPPFLFFDLETTGLSGGAGTYAFIVGTGWFDDDDGFVVEQHLLVGFDRERAMLQLVAEDVSRAGALVSFNGKSFDAPVLETRYLFHRLTSPCPERPHVDVLHPARRFWSGVSESGCSLIALEQLLLGTTRIGDVPGFEIPGRYFQFLRSGDPGPLAAVLEHNRFDLVSLAGITAHLLRLLDHGPTEQLSQREALALGRIYERAGLDDRAVPAFLRVLSASADGRHDDVITAGLRVEASRALALCARRQRRFAEAARWWRALLDMPGCPPHAAREAAEALAIHHEHRVRDLVTAKSFAERNLELGGEPTWGDAARHRLARIERKLVSDRLPLFPFLLPSPPSSASPKSERRTSW